MYRFIARYTENGWLYSDIEHMTDEKLIDSINNVCVVTNDCVTVAINTTEKMITFISLNKNIILAFSSGLYEAKYMYSDPEKMFEYAQMEINKVNPELDVLVKQPSLNVDATTS